MRIANRNHLLKVAQPESIAYLSIVYIRHNLFHQSKLCREIELQKMHIVLFKSPRDVMMEVSTLSAQLDLGPKLVDCH